MANTTPIVTTVTKTATKEKAPNEAETAPRINILDLCEEHYADILRVMDRIRRDKLREKSRSKRRKPTDEEDLAVPWSCEEVDPFTSRIRNFKSSRKTRMPNNVKTYYGTGDPEDHTMEEMMIATTAFIRGEAAAADEKKGHASWRTQDQSKRHTSEKRSEFQDQPREGSGSSRFEAIT
nr:reverse transcriptase domain-containing protein [Tanacetum cinerariifolium]